MQCDSVSNMYGLSHSKRPNIGFFVCEDANICLTMWTVFHISASLQLCEYLLEVEPKPTRLFCMCGKIFKVIEYIFSVVNIVLTACSCKLIVFLGEFLLDTFLV